MSQAKKSSMKNGKYKSKPANLDAKIVRIDTDSAKAKGGFRMMKADGFGVALAIMQLEMTHSVRRENKRARQFLATRK